MKFKLLIVLVVLGGLGGGGYALRTYIRNADPAVKAERLANDGKLREALVELRNAARDNPKDAELHVRIAQVQSKLADPVAAEKEFRTAIQLGADRNVVTPQLGESILVQGRFRDVLREVPARGPNAELLAKNLQLRALAQLSLEELPAAEATLRDAEARAPGRPEVALVAARVAAAHNDVDLMRKKVAEVLKLDPNQVEALLMEEKFLTLQGDRPAALALADRAVKAAPWSAMARIERANQYLFVNDDKSAQADIDAVLQAQPRFIDAVYLNGIMMARRGQLTEAAVQLGKLESVSARMPQGLYYQSLIAYQQGNMQTAAEYARRYAALVPNDPDGMRAVARTELALNRPADALPSLKALTKASPKDPEAFDMLGRAYAASGEGSEAAAAFTTAVNLAPNEPLYRYHVGAQQLQSGRFTEAAANLGSAFEADPKLPGCGPALVRVSIAMNDLPKAEAVLAKLRTAGVDTEDMAELSATIRIRQNDLAGARTVLTEAARRFPNSSDIRVQLAIVLARQGQDADAQTMLTGVLTKEPGKLAAVSTYIRMRAEDRDLPGAIKVLETAHRSMPKDQTMTSMLADALTANGEPRRAIEMVNELGPDSNMPVLVAGALGRAQAAAGRPADAKATYRKVLADSPDDMMIRGLLATLLNNEKDFAGVRTTLEQGLALAPGNLTLMSGLVANEMRWKGVDEAAALADALKQQPGAMPFASLLKGDLYMAVNRPADAGKAYAAEYTATPALPLLIKATTAMAIAGQDEAASALLRGWLKDHPDDAVAAQRLAQLDIQAGRQPEAQTNLGIVLAAQPSNATALNNLAWSYMMSGDKRALQTAQRAYLQEPNALTGDTLGWILVKSGSAKAAVPLLQRALAMRAGDRSIQYHLAVALSDDNRRTEAMAQLQPLVDGPAFPDQEPARKLAEDLKLK